MPRMRVGMGIRVTSITMTTIMLAREDRGHTNDVRARERQTIRRRAELAPPHRR